MARESFGSRASAIMAFAGSAIGLGSIWRFPYMLGENGGAAFLLVYIVSTLILSLPIFIAESVIGRRTHSNCIGAVHKLAPGSIWRILGILSVFTPIFILGYYSVVGGWSIEYLWQAVSFRHTDFADFVGGVWAPLICFAIFTVLTCAIVAGGVKSGIEKFTSFCIPALFVLIVGIAVYSLSLPGSGEGLKYLLMPDFSKLSPKICAYAVGQSFFSLSLGMGIVITYSSYLQDKEDIGFTASGTAISTLFFSFLAGLAIMPAVFAAGLPPAAGPGLVFDSLPYVFSSMAEKAPLLSACASILFYISLLIAALTSSVSLAEVGVAWLVEEFKIRRGAACAVLCLVVLAAGALCSLSFGPLSHITIWGNNIFNIFDKTASNLLLIAGGFLGVLFVGWKMKKADVLEEIRKGRKGRDRMPDVYYFIIKYLAPGILALVFISNFF